MPTDQTPEDRTPDNQWESLVMGLRGAQQAQPESWGGADEVLIARYLAGDCDPQEREVVEQAARSSPEVRECIDVGRAALGGGSLDGAVPPADDPLPHAGLHRVRPAAFGLAAIPWAVAATLLILLGLGAWWVTHTRADSAKALAKAESDLRELRENLDRITQQTGVQSLDEIPNLLRTATEAREQKVAIAVVDDQAATGKEKEVESLKRKLADLEATIKEQEDDLTAMLQREQHVAKLAAVPTFEAIPKTVSALRKDRDALAEKVVTVNKQVVDARAGQLALNKIRGLVGGRSAEEVVKKVAALTVSYADRRKAAAEEGTYPVCDAPCAQPAVSPWPQPMTCDGSP